MNNETSEDRNIIQSTVDRYLRTHYRFERRQCAVQDTGGFNPAVWKEFSELGLLSLSMDEMYGGLGGQCRDAMVVSELLGYHLVTEPLISSGILCSDLIQAFGTEAQRSRYLPSIATGSEMFSFAHTESDLNFANLHSVQTLATATQNGYLLNGKKLNVINASNATHLLVSSAVENSGADPSSANSPTLFVVDTNTVGLTLESHITLDGSSASTVTLETVQASKADQLVGATLSSDDLGKATVKSQLCLSAESNGIASRLLEETWAYAGNREQFGSKITDFQVIQHRLANMYMALEAAKSFVWVACELVDSSAANCASVIPNMRRKVSSACREIAEGAIQIHGGIGTTDELIIGQGLKRLLAIENSLGSEAELAVESIRLLKNTYNANVRRNR